MPASRPTIESRRARNARASLLVGGFGALSGLGAVFASLMFGSFGLVAGLVGLLLGWRGRQHWAGRWGMAVSSFAVLVCVAIVVVLAATYDSDGCGGPIVEGDCRD